VTACSLGLGSLHCAEQLRPGARAAGADARPVALSLPGRSLRTLLSAHALLTKQQRHSTCQRNGCLVNEGACVCRCSGSSSIVHWPCTTQSGGVLDEHLHPAPLRRETSTPLPRAGRPAGPAAGAHRTASLCSSGSARAGCALSSGSSPGWPPPSPRPPPAQPCTPVTLARPRAGSGRHAVQEAEH